MRVLALLVTTVLLAPSLGWASDGRLEISQTCAATGCFPGDSAGFPVTISVSGSYVLTSDLVVANVASNGIQMQTQGVTLDLNGFTVRGPVTCARDQEFQYDASLLACTGSGSGTGVVGSGVLW